jgi:hypothetical protein
MAPEINLSERCVYWRIKAIYIMGGATIKDAKEKVFLLPNTVEKISTTRPKKPIMKIPLACFQFVLQKY